jgi:hypothetical protein
MASYKKLFRLKSGEITSRAQEQKIDGRGTMNKLQKIQALADENMPDDLIEELDQYKSDLEDIAADLGIDQSGKKGDLQARIAAARLNGEWETMEDPSQAGGTSGRKAANGRSGNGTKGDRTSADSAQGGDWNGSSFPDSGMDGDTRKPRKGLESHFQTTEKRREAFMGATEKIMEIALRDRRSQILTESLRPKDKDEPLSVQPSYMKRHPDEFVVLELSIRSEKSQIERIFRDVGIWKAKVMKAGERALKKAIRDSVSQIVVETPLGTEEDREFSADKEWVGGICLEIRHSHKGLEEGESKVMEAIIPHPAYKTNTAEQNPFRD